MTTHHSHAWIISWIYSHHNEVKVYQEIHCSCEVSDVYDSLCYHFIVTAAFVVAAVAAAVAADVVIVGVDSDDVVVAVDAVVVAAAAIIYNIVCHVIA